MKPLRKMIPNAKFWWPFWGQKLRRAHAKRLKVGNQYMYFENLEKLDTNILKFAPPFFYYIGHQLFLNFQGANSLSKMDTNLQILSELDPNPGFPCWYVRTEVVLCV